MYKILFLDTETTGKDPELVEIVELGFLLDHIGATEKMLPFEYQKLIKPTEPIPPEASAVHHITNAMVADKPSIDAPGVVAAVKRLLDQADYICAHNLPYDLTLLKRFMPDLFKEFPAERCIDTLRLARHVLPGLPSYALQVLRYRFDFPDYCSDAHRALVDTHWVADLLRLCLIQKQGHLGLDGIVDFINSPIMVDVMTFGKHRGSSVEEAMAADPGWFRWFEKQAWSIEHTDLLYTIAKLRSMGPVKNA